MIDYQALKVRIRESVEKQSEQIVRLGQEIYENPETGFKEQKTSKLVADRFRQIKLNPVELEDIPGVKVTLDTGREGPGVAVLGELDSIICTEHPDADPKTGAVHACGHNAQVAAMVGAAMAIVDTGAVDHLCGKIHFIAVPAEEYIEVEFRRQLREKGVIKYFGGKPELLHRGFFDDVDLAMMLHTFSNCKQIEVSGTYNGCLVKRIRYIGKAAHAGGAPHKGINALYAANLGLMAINSVRETFQEQDYIRVHPIITKGGDIVNVIPSDVHLETFVRGKSLEAIQQANVKVDRALVGSAFALDAKVEIEDFPGYMPLQQDNSFNNLASQLIEEIVGANEDKAAFTGHSTGSTDLGDLSSLMPVIQPYIGGVEGAGHSADFRIVDPKVAYLQGAKFLACMVVELLSSNAKCAREIVANYQPIFGSKEEYFEYADSLFSKRLLPAKGEILA